jgi:hypothetical protein
MRPLVQTISGLLVSLCFFVSTANAQSDQYTSPGGPDGRPVDRKGALVKEMEEARLKAGPFRIDPVLGIKDVGYVRNFVGTGLSSTPSDFTATGVAGARLYLPATSTVFGSAYALPEYVWWARETERRRFDGLYGAAVDGFWKRLTLGIVAGSDTQQQVATAEVQQLEHVRTDHAAINLEYQLSGAFSLYGTVGDNRTSFLGDSSDITVLQLETLNREDKTERAEVRWRPSKGWLFGAGVVHSATDFNTRVPGAIDESNSGTSPLAELSYNHGRFYFSADVERQSLTATRGSSFVDYDKTTGNASVSIDVSRQVSLWLYASRNLEYTVFSDYSYSTDLRHGAALHISLGRATVASLFGESGSLTYTSLFANAPDRRDDLVAFGATLGVTIGHYGTLQFQASSTRFTSDIPGGGRKLNLVGLTFSLGSLRLPGTGAITP